VREQSHVVSLDSRAVDERLDPAWLEELFEWLRIPSISADPAHADDVRRAGEWLRAFVRQAGGEAELVETDTFPLVVGEIRASNGADGSPTVLLYGHFDVQPPAPLDLWESEPFEPEVRDGYTYARGAVDDKGNAFLLLKAAELLAAESALPVNVRIAFDGEEETAGHSIVDFVAADDRGGDACLIFDTGMPREDVPAFDLATRGNIYYHVRVRTGERDLHSGVFGGAALNAVHALMRTLEAVVGVSDELRAGVALPTDEERRSWQELDPGAAVLQEAGAKPLDDRAADEFYLRTFAGAAVDVHGINGGEALLQKTVLPVAAEANVSIRLAPGQNVEEIDRAFQRLLRDAAPAGAELEIDRWSAAAAGLIPPDTAAVRLAQDAFERVLGRRPLLLRSGGTLPILPALADRGIPTILSGFALPGANMHSPNERLLARYVPLGVAAARETLVAFGGLR
jgi:acetylornithine deacetylase/succinyl-diaminopimelate desuccinylase-like protein